MNAHKPPHHDRRLRPVTDEERARVVAALVAMEAEGIRPTVGAMRARIRGHHILVLVEIRNAAIAAGMLEYRVDTGSGLNGRTAEERAEVDAAIEAAHEAKAEAMAKVERLLPLALRPCRFLGNKEHYTGRADR